MRKTILIVVFSVGGLFVSAQPINGAFDGLFPPSASEDGVPRSDTTLFLLPADDLSGLFGRLTEYRFGAVRYRPRGYDASLSDVRVAGLSLLDRLSGGPEYSLLSLLRSAFGAPVQAGPAGTAGRTGPPGGTFDYRPQPRIQRPDARLTFLHTDRRYRYGVRLRSEGSLARHWAYRLMGQWRWGRDMHAGGVFADGGGAAFVLTGAWKRDRIDGIAALAPVERGLRSYSVEETFALSGDPLYNPVWGYYDGKVRNSRVARAMQPLAALAWSRDFADAGHMTLAVGVRTGRSSYSALQWQHAADPRPDYYRYLPSYFGSGSSAAASLTERWRAGDPRVVQIDWGRMAESNRYGDGTAYYLVEERVERVRRYEADWAFHGVERNGWRWSAGVHAAFDRSRFFKEARDLLGASCVLDRDYRLEEYGGASHPHLAEVLARAPRVEQGGRFGYDYAVRRSAASAYGALHYRRGRLGVDLSAEYGTVAMRRAGYRERGDYPAERALGLSSRARWMTGALGLSATWTFSARHLLAFAAGISRRAPEYTDVFLSPRYSNDATPWAKAVRVSNLELSYTGFLPFGMVVASVYGTQVGNRTDIYRYYDDLNVEYSNDENTVSDYLNLVVGDIDLLYCGVELSGRFDPAPRFSIEAAAAWTRHVYAGDPQVEAYYDYFGERAFGDERALLRGYACDSSPQTVALLAVDYRPGRGWYLRASAGYAGRRYVRLNPLRRTLRTIGFARSPEQRAELVQQERLPDAVTLDASFGRYFDLGRGHSLYVLFSVDNLLDGRGIVYDSYESMRLRRLTIDGKTTYVPAPSYRLYAYPIGYHFSLTYRF